MSESKNEVVYVSTPPQQASGLKRHHSEYANVFKFVYFIYVVKFIKYLAQTITKYILARARSNTQGFV